MTEAEPDSTPATTPSLAKLIFSSVYILLGPAALFLLSGDWRWVEGWIFSAWFIALCAWTVIYLYRRDPALLAERLKRPGTGGQKGWDVYVIYAVFAGFIAWIIIMPLDAKRYAWTAHFPLWLKALGGGALVASSFFLVRAYTDNTFLSPLVRIQKERQHRLVSTGVYAFVRHPMYLGAVLLFIGAPILLGSFWGIVIGVAMTLLVAGRIVGEEKMLTQDLEGYADYKTRVRYRLIPFVW
jgi:protein-S-isoprenylcysteine O-methyltransferase Ste14